ncbi:MAG: exodeoxyribonuclease V subunit gamma [Bacteroidetes bacterium]|nr:exodeoxyribonuclease V subunit gamma [Bacteroidota bacterium]
MALGFYVSDDLSALARKLSGQMNLTRQDAFTRQFIVTQTEGMNNWLKVQVAEYLGIAANVVFPKPNDVVLTIRGVLSSAVRPALTQDYMRWRLYRLLSESEFTAQFPDVANYYEGEPVKRMALAARLSDLFDQYQVYRTETIIKWNSGAKIELQHEQWQQWLWYRLREDGHYRPQDKTELITDLLQALKQPEQIERLRSKMPAIHFFGIAVITPYYMKLFSELSEWIDVNFYLLNPAPDQYWFDYLSEKQIARYNSWFYRNGMKTSSDWNQDLEGNSLLLNLGKIIKGSFRVLFENDRVFNVYEYVNRIQEKPFRTLLGKIQDDIYRNAVATECHPITATDRKDGSITINSCHTPLREVEVLYDFLIGLIDQKNQKLSPKDVVVMVTDIDAYAPYIRAVFDHAPYQIPYNIADESLDSGNNLFYALRLLMDLDEEKFSAESVLELLESTLIRERAGITDVALIRKLVRSAGIKFGWNGEREEETHYYSWTYGLERLMYGICIGGEAPFFNGVETILPLDVIEGNASDELLRFYVFVNTLQKIIQKRAQARTLENWREYLHEVVGALIFQPGEKEYEDYHRFIQVTESMAGPDAISSPPEVDEARAENQSPIEFEVIRYSLKDMLQTVKRTHAFTGGGITFCSLIPMRSIPAEVIAMLGMNFDAFPRKETVVNFSLFAKDPRPGDRNVRDNDRHLFLETLLSARSFLYISFTGIRVTDAVAMPPSTVVDELLDYLIENSEDKVKIKREDLIGKQPLHNYSRKYFTKDSGFRTYLTHLNEGNGFPKAEKDSTDKKVESPNVNAADLIQFFGDPLKWYVNRVLNIYYREKEILLPDTEMFELNKLDEWKLSDLQLRGSENNPDRLRESLVLNGQLPLRNAGRYYIQKNFNENHDLMKAFKEAMNGAAERRIQVNVSTDKGKVVGLVGQVYGDRMVLLLHSKSSRNKNLVSGFVQYILAVASGEYIELWIVDEKNPNLKPIVKGLYSKKKATVLVEGWMEAFRIGNRACYPFVPGLEENVLEAFKMSADDYLNELGKKIRKAEEEEYSGYVQDPHFLLMYRSGFFSLENYAALQTNMLSFFGLLNKHFPF